MKLRIIKRTGLYVPQFYKKTYYSNGWNGFGSPNIKFAGQKQAEAFVKLIDESVPTGTVGEKIEVVYRNFTEEPKKSKLR